MVQRGATRWQSEMESSMDLFESQTHSFVIKIWFEDEGQKKWRGQVTHVPDGRRQYFENLSDILTFINPYLEMPESGTAEKKTPWRWFWRFRHSMKNKKR
jgi:hypothetical protein